MGEFQISLGNILRLPPDLGSQPVPPTNQAGTFLLKPPKGVKLIVGGNQRKKIYSMEPFRKEGQRHPATYQSIFRLQHEAKGVRKKN